MNRSASVTPAQTHRRVSPRAGNPWKSSGALALPQAMQETEPPCKPRPIYTPLTMKSSRSIKTAVFKAVRNLDPKALSFHLVSPLNDE